jgi:hypothetical protein
MKKLILWIALALLSGPETVRALDLPPEVKEFLQTQHVMDDGYRSIPPTSSGHVFRQYITSNWQAVLDNFAPVAPEPREKQLIISALEEDLPARIYLKALNKLCDLQKNNVISAQLLEYAVRGPRSNLLSNNYKDSEVIELVNRFQSQLRKNSDAQQCLADILSGKQRAIDIEGAEEVGNPPPETLPPR